MPSPTLSVNPQPHVENFYQNSFRQLSSVQQKQVGLIVGAAVADAAARGMAGRTAEEVVQYEQEALAYEREYAESERKSTSPTPPTPPAHMRDVFSPLVFAHSTVTSSSSQVTTSASAVGGGAPAGTAELLAFHSFSYHLFYDLLRTMSAARGDFPVHYVTGKWVETANGVATAHPQTYKTEVGSLLHTLCTLLPVPTIYPYASDETMRSYVAPFIDVLTRVPSSTGTAAALSNELQLPAGGEGEEVIQTTIEEVQAAERALAVDMTCSALGVAIRFLQSNPDPERNGALMAVPGTAALFPPDSALLVPSAAAANLIHSRYAAINKARMAAASFTPPSSSSSPLVLPQRPVLRDAATIREGLQIVKQSRTFASGVVRAVRLGGPVCQRAMLVGALLGAKLGARQIPLPWLSATADHQPVSTMSIEVAQWSWNPPHR